MANNVRRYEKNYINRDGINKKVQVHHSMELTNIKNDAQDVQKEI